MQRTVVLIPAFNEQDVIGETVSAALRMPDIAEVLVVDDGSEDETPFVAYRPARGCFNLMPTWARAAR